jgi:hypothetical protein
MNTTIIKGRNKRYNKFYRDRNKVYLENIMINTICHIIYIGKKRMIYRGSICINEEVKVHFYSTSLIEFSKKENK